MNRLTGTMALHGLAGLTGLMLAGSAVAACAVQDWDGKGPVPAPTLQPGTTWTYSSGRDTSPVVMKFEALRGSEADYRINGNIPYTEALATYTPPSQTRVGEKQLLRFPLQVGDKWTDTFTETGEVRLRKEHYRYRYQETATSKVAGVEEITVAAGTFRTLRVDRLARWVKDRPEALDQVKRQPLESGLAPKAEGYTLTQMWYAPALGRAILKTTELVGGGHKVYAAEGLLDNPLNGVVELTAYQAGDTVCAGSEPVLARRKTPSLPLGFIVVPLDTWEWELDMYPHIPMRIDPPPAKP